MSVGKGYYHDSVVSSVSFRFSISASSYCSVTGSPTGRRSYNATYRFRSLWALFRCEDASESTWSLRCRTFTSTR